MLIFCNRLNMNKFIFVLFFFHFCSFRASAANNEPDLVASSYKRNGVHFIHRDDPSFTCPQSTGFFAIPDAGCSSDFYLCDRFIPYLMTCDETTLYNPQTISCDYPNNVPGCTGEETVAPTTETTNPTTSNIISTTAILTTTLPELRCSPPSNAANNSIHCSVEPGLGCYCFVFLNKTWSDADAYCRNELGTFLVAIETKEEDEMIDRVHKTFVSQELTTPFRPLWTSGSDEFQIENEWIWTSNGLRFNFTNWVLGEPNNFAGIEHYLQKNINGTNNKWNDVNHAESDAHFICEGYTNYKPISDPRCQSSLNGVRCSYQPGFGCYCFVSSAMTRNEAYNFCKNKLGNQLVSIESNMESDMLAEFSNGKSFYISGSDVSSAYSTRKWVWQTTSKNLTYTNWCPGQPSNNRKDRYIENQLGTCWNNTRGSSRISFICEGVTE